MIKPKDEGYYEVENTWVKWECEEHYATDWLRSINEHWHYVLPKKYNKRKWPGNFAGFTVHCKGVGRTDPEFLRHVEHAKYLHDKLPGGKPKPLIIGGCISGPGPNRSWLSVGDKETVRSILSYWWWRAGHYALLWRAG